MRLRWFGLLLAVLVVGTACSSADRPPWAEEAEAWHEELLAAQMAQGGAGFARFLAPDVVWDDSAVYGEESEWFRSVGIEALERAIALLGPESLAMEAEFFVSSDGLINFLLYDWAPLGNHSRPDTAEPAHGVSIFSRIGPLGSESLVNAMAIEDWRTRHRGPEADEAEAVATSWIEIWSGEVDQIASLYDADAQLSDRIGGVEATDREAIADVAANGGEWKIAKVGGDAVEGVYPFIRRGSAGLVLQEVVLVASGRDESGCTGRLGVWLALDDGRVVEEARYWSVERARTCLPPDELPNGWWTNNPSPPQEPLEDVETPSEPLVVGNTTVTIYNGTEALNELLAWGLGRFDAAGLRPPLISSATFTRFSQRCDDIRGAYHKIPNGADLLFCFDEAAACRNDDCTIFTPASRVLVLHELAHAWIDVNLDDTTRTRFKDHVGLDVWSDHDVDWIERALEHATDTIAWGLMDRELAMYRLGIPPPSVDHLATGFRILTGTDPLPQTDQSQPLQQTTPDG